MNVMSNTFCEIQGLSFVDEVGYGLHNENDCSTSDDMIDMIGLVPNETIGRQRARIRFNARHVRQCVDTSAPTLRLRLTSFFVLASKARLI